MRCMQETIFCCVLKVLTCKLSSKYLVPYQLIRGRLCLLILIFLSLFIGFFSFCFFVPFLEKFLRKISVRENFCFFPLKIVQYATSCYINFLSKSWEGRITVCGFWNAQLNSFRSIFCQNSDIGILLDFYTYTLTGWNNGCNIQLLHPGCFYYLHFPPHPFKIKQYQTSNHGYTNPLSYLQEHQLLYLKMLLLGNRGPH